jgi:hypothetical protein
MWDKIFFDLDGTLRSSYYTEIPDNVFDMLKCIKLKYNISIITDNDENKDLIELKTNNICEIICPIDKHMNPDKRDWFMYEGYVYILKFNIDHNMAISIKNSKGVRVIEDDFTINSDEYNQFPNIKLPYIGMLIEYIKKTFDCKIEIIGKKTYNFQQYKTKKCLMVGNALNDKIFAENHGFSFIDVNDKPIIDILSLIIKQ